MQKLKEKSEFNQNSAELLINNGYYAPSVHCSYYAVFQLLNCKCVGLIDGLDITALREGAKQSQRGSHNHIIDLFFKNDKIEKLVTSALSDTRALRQMRLKIKDLKAYRTESDYEDVEVDHMKSRKAYEISNELITNLKKIRK